ncbi:hypothetical protein OG728_39030 (plasmid) [Streptomyces microflavus]|uniref:hypothetical protein n=1 Tax=Streptomyces microflavus TaxID=1919 RepID=UPI002E10CE40|nr:hypothetical protein OG728_39030 [Streptomyces microflavus]
MSDEGSPEITWDEVAYSWRIDELVEGTLPPTRRDDVLMLATIGALRAVPPLNDSARQMALDAMLTAAENRTEPASNQEPRDPARIEQTRLAMLRTFEEARRRRNE